MARSLSSLLRIQFVLLALCVCSFTFGVKDGPLDPTSVSRSSNRQVSLTPRRQVQFNRTAEVNENCPRLTPREREPDNHPAHDYLLRQRLSFEYGDWEEADFGSTPIVPFLQWNETALPAKTKLASFWVSDFVNQKMLKGTMQLIITDGSLHFFSEPSPHASFTMRPGVSVLSIEMEGIYQQTENEDVVCMLGCAFLPSPDGGVQFSNTQNSFGNKTLEKNCDIKMQLNYPIKFNLTSRIVRGTIQSLVPRGERYHFTPITFSSQVQYRPNFYEPAPADFVNSACPADASSESDSTVYKAPMDEFCAITNRHLENSVLDIEPNWMCNGTTQNCQTIGPFSSYAEGTSYQADYNKSRAQIVVLPAISTPCYYGQVGPDDEVPLSFVLRLVPASEQQYVAIRRSGLDGHTLVAEGYWNNRSSTLCMIACNLDDASGQTDNCNFRVTFQIPLHISITQRNMFKGSISSLLAPDHSESFFPLAFHLKLNLNHGNLPYGYRSALRYNYSRLAHAGAVLGQHEPESWSSLKTPWFKYPSLIGEQEGHYQSLADDLNFDIGLKMKPGQRRWRFLNFDIVAIDKYLPFARFGFTTEEGGFVNDTITTKTDPRPNRRQEERKYLNCSGTLEFVGEVVNFEPELLTIFTEGLYKPSDGKMYMVGCRTIKGSWEQIADSSYDLIDGMDCEIEVVLEYPTTLSAWLLNPGVKVNVHSNRPVTNLFHFDDIVTETDPIFFKGQREQVISSKSFEAALSVLALSLTLMCIITQLLYIGNHEESTPYISLSMLGAQAMGYAIPLITGAESLLARKFDYRQDQFFQETGSVKMIIYVDKILTLVALLLFLRLFEKVWRERRSLSELGDAGNVPRERSVIVICFIIHAIGFISVLGLHSRHSPARVDIANPPPVVGDAIYEDEIWTLEKSYGEIHRGHMWQVSQEYTGLIEDLFLLPQVVGFGLWDVTGKPLRKCFFVGLTLLQIVPHVYDYLRPMRFGFSGAPMYANPDFDFYTDVGNILIPALALILALLVYCQQKWKGFLRLPRRFLYQPLGTKSSETELVSTNGRNHLPPIPEDDE